MNTIRQLVREVIDETLEELLSSSNTSVNSTLQLNKNNKPGMSDLPAMDTMTPLEKAKVDRETEKQRRDALKQGEAELKTAKKERDFQQEKVKQASRFKIPTLQKQIQSLKGGVSHI